MVALAGPRDTHMLDRLFACQRAVHLCVLEQHVLDLVADLADRVECQPRRLENHRHFAAAQIAHLIFRRGAQINAAEHHRAIGNTARAVENAHHRVGGDRFTGAGFTDDCQ